MNKRYAFIGASAAFLLPLLAFAQMGMGGGMGRGMGDMGGSGTMGSILRHRYVMTHGIDPAYARASNPLPTNDANLSAGKALYAKNCATCHGPTGRGDGPAAKGLALAPADLTAAMGMPMASDAYLAWTISEGGIPVRSAMPAFKATLTKDDLWKLVIYLRRL